MNARSVYRLISLKLVNVLLVIIFLVLIISFSGHFLLDYKFIGINFTILDSIICKLILLILMLIGLGLVLIRRTNSLFVTESLVETGTILTNTDMKMMKKGMADLALGNLAARVDIQSKPVSQTGSEELNKLVYIINSIVSTLVETAQEFNAVTDEPCMRLCYVGTDSFLEGQRCGEVMGKLLNGKGQVAIGIQAVDSANMELRRKGFESAINKKYPDIQVVAIIENIASIEQATQSTLELIEKVPKLSGIYLTKGATAAGVARAVIDSHKKGEIKIVTHDLMNSTMQYVKQGAITGTFSQDPYAQGHDPVIHLYNHIAAGWKPITPYMFTNQNFVNPDNYHQFWQESQGSIRTDEDMKRLAKPSPTKNNPDRPIRIAVIASENSEFWLPIKEGALAAKEELKPYNVIVDWIIPEGSNKGASRSIKYYGPAFESILKKKYDGLATIAISRDYIPYLNRLVEAGIPVVTFFSEPTSLRAVVYTVTQQARKLNNLSENLANSAAQANQGIAKINKSMDEMAERANLENKQVNRTKQVLGSLLQTIENVNRNTERVAESAERTSNAVIVSADAMEKTMDSVRAIGNSVRETWGIVKQVSEHSKQIDVVIELINDIASRVNVLALNAAIEATKAGEFGKGFKVVAKEIRTLAKKTSGATLDVNNLIGAVQKDFDKVDKLMEGSIGKMDQSSQLTDNSLKTLDNIRTLVDENKNRLQHISEAMMQMEQSSNEVNDAMSQVAKISDQNSVVVENVNTLTKSMTEQFESVAKSAQILELVSQSEEEMLAKFNTADV